MKIGESIRQGDVLLIKAAVPESDKTGHKPVAPDAHNRLVLAHGETSGHMHLFRDPGVSMLAREGVSDRVITTGGDVSALLHDQGSGTFVPTGDHHPVAVPPGTYIVRQQREWGGEEAFDALD